MLSCVSRGLAELLGRWSGGWCASAVGTAGDSGLSGVEQEIDFTGEIALEASDGLEFGVALGGLLGYVGLGFRVQADAADHGQVQCPVGLPITAAVEPVSLCHS